MATSLTNFGLTLAERVAPSQERIWRHTEAIEEGIRVAVPAVVQAFDAVNQTVDVMAVTAEIVQRNANAPDVPVNMVREARALPVLHEVPVMIATGGGWDITFPIQAGDECILLFSDTILDHWLDNGSDGKNALVPVDTRRHDLSDAVALFGVRSKPRKLQNYSAQSMQIRSDDASVIIDLAAGKITITCPAVALANGTLQVNKGFSCNGQSPQSAAGLGVAATASVTGPPNAWGFASAADVTTLVNLVNNMRQALIANGIGK